MSKQVVEFKNLPVECIAAQNILPQELQNSLLIQSIILEIYNGWPGKTGIDRVARAITFIANRIPQYAEFMGMTLLDTMEKVVIIRRVNYANWFQDAYLPDLSNVLKFDNKQAFLEGFPSGKFTCPSCNHISTDPTTCNSGREMAKGIICDWKVYGLFGGLGKEVKIVLKDVFLEKTSVLSIFPPIELK